MVELIEIENGSARYSRADGTAINCRVKFSHMPGDWLPFTAMAGDPLPHVQAAWAALQEMEIAPYVAPVPTQADYQKAVEAHVESVAAQRGYASAASCAGYVNSSVPGWAEEAAAFVAWRDAVWMHVFAQLALVQSGERTQPTVADLIAELPAISWPA